MIELLSYVLVFGLIVCFAGWWTSPEVVERRKNKDKSS